MACKECGQEVPVVNLTTREKIEALRLPNTLGSGAKSLIEKIVDILSELEARPTVTFFPTTFVPNSPPPSVPWQTVPAPTQVPYVPARPYVGDPLPRWGESVCKAESERNVFVTGTSIARADNPPTPWQLAGGGTLENPPADTASSR